MIPAQPTLSPDELRELLKPMLTELLSAGVSQPVCRRAIAAVTAACSTILERRLAMVTSRTFSADSAGARPHADAARFREHFRPNAEGLYAGGIHHAFGMGVKEFSDTAKVRRTHRGGKWYWQPRPTA